MRRNSLLLAGCCVLAASVAACDLEETAGLSRNLGAPLLDIALGPSGDAAMPTIFRRLTSRTSRDTLTVTLRNLGPLPAGAVYQWFLVDSMATTGDNAFPVAGQLTTQTRTRRPVDRDFTAIDTVNSTNASATAITQADTNQTFTLRLTDARVRTSTHFVVAVVPTVQTAARRIDPAARFGFLSVRHRTGRITIDSVTANDTATGAMGSWAVNTARRLRFTPSSATVTGSFRGSTVRLNVRDLIRPPEGFRYAGWVIDSRTGMAARLGGLVTPVPSNRPLDNADLGEDAFLTDVAIIEAQLRSDTAMAGNIRWEDFTSIVLLLEPKGSAPPTRPGGAYVLGGPVPPSVAGRSPGAGKVSGTVTKTSGGSAAGATVFLTGTSDRTPRLVANASATGTFIFRTVPVGQYWAFVIPVGGRTPTDSASITINTRMVNGFAVGDSVGIALRIP